MLSALVLGCGVVTCGKPPEEAEEPSEQADIDAVADFGNAAPSKAAADEEEVLPAFTPEALAARFDAQRALLGEESLFEDADGRPLAPPLEPVEGETDGTLVGSLEDELLLALPGSAGFNVDESGQLTVGSSQTGSNGNALGLYVPVETPRSGAPLARFHAALEGLREGRDDDGKVRVLIYGASHTQADVYPGYLRAYLQARFGDGGSGFLSLTRVNRWFRYTDWTIEDSKGWTVEHAQRRDARKDGFYGLLGASGSTSNKRDRTVLSPRYEGVAASQFELFYLEQPGGGSFKLYVDGNRHATISTKADQPGPGYHAITLEEGAHTLEIRPNGDGEVRLFGVTAERDQPGVVVDTLGISGTRAANMLDWHEPTWADNVARRKPDLIVLAYGTNETTDEDQSLARYRAELREVVTRLQDAAPQANCLLIGPGDFPRELDEDVWVPRPRLVEIVETQRDVAYEMGCGFWDTLAFMGGVNSMHTWATSRPQMASRDHIHLTKRGYVRMGMALTDALMAAYDRAFGPE